MARDFQSLSLRQLQPEAQVLEEKKERDVHLAILKEELKIVREKNEYIKKLKKKKHMHHMYLVLGRVTPMLRKRVLELMNIINLHLEELEEKANQKRLG